MNSFALNEAELDGSVEVYADSSQFNIAFDAAGDNLLATLFPVSSSEVTLSSSGDGLLATLFTESSSEVSFNFDGLGNTAVLGNGQANVISTATSDGYCLKYIQPYSSVVISQSLYLVKRSYIIGDTSSTINVQGSVIESVVAGSNIEGKSLVILNQLGNGRLEVRGNSYFTSLNIDANGVGRTTGQVDLSSDSAIVRFLSPAFGHVAYASQIQAPPVKVRISPSVNANLIMSLTGLSASIGAYSSGSSRISDRPGLGGNAYVSVYSKLDARLFNMIRLDGSIAKVSVNLEYNFGSTVISNDYITSAAYRKVRIGMDIH